MSAATTTAPVLAPRATRARLELSPVQAGERALWGSNRAPRVLNGLCRYCGVLSLEGGAHDGCDTRRVAAVGNAYYRMEDRTDAHGFDYQQMRGVIIADTGACTELYGIESDRPFFDRPERPRHGDRTPADHTGPVLFD